MQNTDNIFDLYGGHRYRVRRRLEGADSENLSDLELLEFLLCYALPRQDVKRVARSLLDRFENLRGVFNASLDDLAGMDGMGDITLEWLDILQNFIRCFYPQEEETPDLTDYQLVGDYARELEPLFEAPCCVVLGMDKYFHPLAYQQMCSGRKWANPRTVLKSMSEIMPFHPENLVILVYTGKLASRFTNYDIHHIREFAFTFHKAGADVMDMMLVNAHHIDSMRMQDLIEDPELTKAQAQNREYYTLRATPPTEEELLEQLMEEVRRMQEEIEPCFLPIPEDFDDDELD